MVFEFFEDRLRNTGMEGGLTRKVFNRERVLGGTGTSIEMVYANRTGRLSMDENSISACQLLFTLIHVNVNVNVETRLRAFRFSCKFNHRCKSTRVTLSRSSFRKRLHERNISIARRGDSP